MVHLLLRGLVPAALAAAALAAPAQTAKPGAKLDPLDAKASVPALVFESSFIQYRRLGDDKPIAWRDANDTVARIGGWRAYAREAQQPDAAAPAPPPQSLPPSEPVKPVPSAPARPKTR